MKRGYALVTGGSSGIGEALSYRLAAEGWPLFIVSNRAEENLRVAAHIAQQWGVEVETLTLDLCRAEAAEELLSSLESRGVEVELLVSNAGMLQFSTLERTPVGQIDRLVALHCATPTKLCRLLAEKMALRGRVYILLVSSLTAWMPYPTISLYAATKSYLRMLGRALWYEMRPKGVQVTTLFPSAVDTPLYAIDEGVRRRLRWWGLMLSADRVAEAALRGLFRGRRDVLPGFWCKLLARLARWMPAWALLPILKMRRVRELLERV